VSTAAGRFPPTHHSVVRAAGSTDPALRARAVDAVVRAYWRPVYAHLRLRWRLERPDAEDLTQEFFARALDGELFARFDPGRARFRTYLRACVDALAANEWKAARRLKRGGGAAHVPLDFAAAEGELRELYAGGADAERVFHDEWVRALFAGAVEALRLRCEAAGRTAHLALFERYDLAEGDDRRPTYAELAAELSLPVTQVTNYLAAVRRDFRRLVLERLREATADDAEFRAEARELLGLDVA
jgi:DNA-directed RNA polymerase specialized sigma24 family protein